MTVTFRVLGTVEAVRDGTPIALSGKPLVLLACLLVRANSTVSIDALAAALWGETGAHGKGAIQTCVRRLRRALGDEVVRTQGAGYRIDAGPDELDLKRFRALMAGGEQAVAAGDDAGAAARFGEAVALWRGPALANVESDVLHREDVAALNEQRLAVWQHWADAELRLGRPPIAELTRLIGEHPLHEPFWQQLMQALHQAGRTADALAAYRQLSAVLADELGLDPSPPLQDLHQAILTGDAPLPAAAAAAPAPPRQLSAAIDGFRGRSEELAQLAKMVGAGSGNSAIIATIEGTAGVGKTTLAVRFAHEVADEFPDGHVQLNLHGHGPGEPVPPSAALESLLQSLGIGGEQLPASLDARAALWRTHTSGRKILVLLDNARNSDQLRPLLPGPGCLVLVTSRSRLHGLTARDGAERLSVGRLDEDDALDLLAQTVGAQRVHADPAASRRFVVRCAYLPLAIRILGEYADQQRDRPLADIVDEVAAGSDRLAYFDLDDGDDTNLRAVFGRSYAALDDEAARLFRLLGRHIGRTFAGPVAAALAERPVAVTERLLQRLVRAHLLEQHASGRYEFHDLLREYAVSLAGQADGAAAERRALDWYVHSAVHVYDVLRPGWLDERPTPPSGLHLPTITGHADAMRWCTAEHDNLLAAVDLASALQLHRLVCDLVLVLRPYFHHVPVRDGWFASHEVAVESARAIGDRRAEGQLLCSLGVAHVRFATAEEALPYCRSALAIARELGNRDDEFAALNDLGLALWHVADHDQAVAVLEQALAVARRLDRRRELIARSNLADAYVSVERFADAIDQADAGLDLAADSGEPNFKAYVLLTLAGAQAGLDDDEAALANLQAALALAREAGAVLGQADALEKMADIHAKVGEPEAASERYDEALGLLTTLGHRNAQRIRTKRAALADDR
ncbi:MAG TPA: BTAD domain-containing putative transcriptional regulator [Jatrophihabitantaceae bacterium]